MTTCTRRFQFCAGHRVLNHESKCRNLHGHNYVVFVECRMWGGEIGHTVDLDKLGRVIDFGVLKQRLGEWFEQNWDHGFIVFDQDSAVRNSLGMIADQKMYLLPVNPTAENLAKHLLNHICPAVLQGLGVKVVSVVVHETENCFAAATL